MRYRLDSYTDKLFIVIFTLATIVILINPLFLIPLNIQKVFASGVQFPDNNTNDKLDNIADLFVFGSGIFAGILCTLSLYAYRNLDKASSFSVNCFWYILCECYNLKAGRIRSDNRIIYIRSGIGDFDFRSVSTFLYGNRQT